MGKLALLLRYRALKKEGQKLDKRHMELMSLISNSIQLYTKGINIDLDKVENERQIILAREEEIADEMMKIENELSEEK